MYFAQEEREHMMWWRQDEGEKYRLPVSLDQSPKCLCLSVELTQQSTHSRLEATTFHLRLFIECRFVMSGFITLLVVSQTWEVEEGTPRESEPAAGSITVKKEPETGRERGMSFILSVGVDFNCWDRPTDSKDVNTNTEIGKFMGAVNERHEKEKWFWVCLLTPGPSFLLLSALLCLHIPSCTSFPFTFTSLSWPKSVFGVICNWLPFFPSSLPNVVS